MPKNFRRAVVGLVGAAVASVTFISPAQAQMPNFGDLGAIASLPSNIAGAVPGGGAVPNMGDLPIDPGALGGAMKSLESIPGANMVLPQVAKPGGTSDEEAMAGISWKKIGGNMVAYGDSYFADGTATTANAKQDGVGTCPRSETNPPSRAAGLLGMNLSDYSCSGAVAGASPSLQIASQISKSISDGNLNADTDAVAISIGGNDMMTLVAMPQEQRIAAYRELMTEHMTTIRGAAPNARVVLVGYPEVVGAQGNFCPVAIGSPIGIGLPIPMLGQVEMDINNYQAVVADELGIDFLDLKGSTAGHGICANDKDRWVSAPADLTNKNSWEMPAHVTSAGNAHMGARIAEHLSMT